MTQKYTFTDGIFDQVCKLIKVQQIAIDARKVLPLLDEKDVELFTERRRAALRNLERKGLVRLRQHRGFIRVQLTASGQHERVLRGVARQEKRLSRGMYCYVIFDIPETRRIARRAFVRFFRAAHFIKLQKSVWRTEYDVRRELRELIRIHHAGSMIKVIIGKELT